MEAGANTCPYCRASNSPGKHFCGDCGAHLPRICAACGAPSPQPARYCADCGAALSGLCSACGGNLLPDRPYCILCGTRVSASGAYTGGSPVELGPESHPPQADERRLVTALFCDLVGFTPL